MKNKKNICVIGSGFSGISSATYLASQGHNVYILEKNLKLGGRARQFSAKGFTFDMGPSWYWMPDVFEKYFKDFGEFPEHVGGMHWRGRAPKMVWILSY